MISQTTEYALRAMVLLCSDTDRSWKTSEIARLTKVPPDYLAKVLQQLGRADLVVGTRGAGGGFRLAKDPKGTTLLEVVNAVDPLPRIRTCPLGLRSHGTRLCALHKRLDAATQLVENAFGESTLAELVAQSHEPTASRPCDFPLRASTAPTKSKR
ncbi:MAG TPA: Rrf2 family transcriptional regulator [Bdellovibrionota bacterium]|jgi:Rrf2 family protein|nr:Rrf2 family transcriptional regulator [Bdellovibrionota bacterium]